MHIKARSAHAAIIIILLTSLITPSPAYAKTILIDGVDTGGEWIDLTPIINDPDERGFKDDVDIKAVWATYDSTHAYYRVDTYGAPTDKQKAQLQIYLNTDSSASNGCDDIMGHTGDGNYDRRLWYHKVSKEWKTEVDRCNAANQTWEAVPEVEGLTDCNQFYEFSAPREALGIASTSVTVQIYVLFDDGTGHSGDEAPDSGTSTLISLGSFTATSKNNGILLEWETLSEMDNAGFSIWRSTSKGEGYVKINPVLITAEGGPTERAVYSYLDTSVQSGENYSYRLEDIDTNGVSHFSTLEAVIPKAEAKGKMFLYLPTLIVNW